MSNITLPSGATVPKVYVTTLYDPRLTFPTNSLTFDPTKPQKPWSIEVSGEFSYESVNNFTGKYESYSMTAEEARVTNISNIDSSKPSNILYNQAMVPIPMLRPPDGFEVVVNPFGIFDPTALVVPITPSVSTVTTSTEDPNIVTILNHLVAIKNGLNSILVTLGKPQV